jgi:antitoxin PrlF
MYAKITSKGQITIPREVRQQLNLEKGSIVSFTVTNGHAELTPVKDDIMALRGSVPVNTPQDFDAIEIEVEKQIAQEVTRNA